MTECCLRMNDLGSDALPLIRHGCAAPPSPRGRLLNAAFRRNSHRQPTNGARRSAVVVCTGHVNGASEATGPTIGRGDYRSTQDKGVLRTVGSKRVFAKPQRGVSERNRAQRGSWRGDGDFLLAQKVTRRRHDKVSKHRRVPTKRQGPSSEDKSAGPGKGGTIKAKTTRS